MKLIATLFLSIVLIASPMSASASTKPIITVLGDSISSLDTRSNYNGGYKYNDTSRSSMQAWWSILRKQTGHRVRAYTNAGSGYGKRAKSCRLNSFYDSSLDPKVIKDVKRSTHVIIAGGVNDSAQCGTGLSIRDSTAKTLANIRAANPKVKIIVTAPWGTHKSVQAHRSATLAAIKSAARAVGGKYVATPLYKSRTLDSVHPNRAGNDYMARKIRLSM